MILKEDKCISTLTASLGILNAMKIYGKKEPKLRDSWIPNEGFVDLEHLMIRSSSIVLRN